jgi:hypothetical protein
MVVMVALMNGHTANLPRLDLLDYDFRVAPDGAAVERPFIALARSEDIAFFAV